MSLRLFSHLRNSRKIIFSLGNSTSFHRSAPALYAAPIQLKMPSLSPTMTEGNIVKWHKKEGDKVVPGDVLMEIQTDKAVIAFETEEEGTVAKILIPDDSKNIQVGTLVGLISLPGDDWKNVAVPESVPSQANKTVAAKVEVPTVQPTQTSSTSDLHTHHELPQRIGPAARNLLISYQIDPSQIKASGPHGFILKRIYIDVKAYIDQHNLTPKQITSMTEPLPVHEEPRSVPATSAKKSAGANPEQELDYEDIELTNMRKVIAKRLVFSKTTIPHSYASANCLVDKIIELRKEMIKNNQKVSINDFITKAVGLALRMVPELNSNINEKTGEYTQLTTVDISTAVATDKGLITPIIKNADSSSVLNISEKVKELAEKARQGKLLPHEFQGGSFTISNLGMFGVKEFSAVINPPQIAILAVGKSQVKFTEEMKTRTEVTLTLSYDERCCSADRAMKFLDTLNYFLSNPGLLVEKEQSF